jgi:hypothetical protein
MADEEARQTETNERDEAEAMARLREEISNLPVSEHLVYMLHSLSSLAVDRLGLAEGAAARRDPAQARLAIDAFKAMLGVVEPERPAEEITTYRGMLAQLQMAYVGALSARPAAEAAEAGAPESAPEAAAPDGPATPQAPEAAAEPAAEAPAAAAPEPAPEAAKKAAKPRAGAGGAGTKAAPAGATKGASGGAPKGGKKGS